ncbi:hypothetical protein BT96DRAFT_947730 [Gymnopus androsaceus JB14]|uniref:Uncharacterized protein n=1 Tax=Gymnopus androsaceus JB14 TaxID=1447944 RepID=A0A6A4GR65_9AGAR|nr:hypothetical protein BT96DRAFT_947730 [Gymnopus androsaceus JB14]
MRAQPSACFAYAILTFLFVHQPEFVPEGCSAGVQYQDAYAFADSHNITLMGVKGLFKFFDDKNVSTGSKPNLKNTNSGLSLSFSLQLQFKVDLFFALRGGRGTFGVVMESTVLTFPQLTLQVVLVSFSSTNGTALTCGLLVTVVTNGIQRAEQGWGGVATSNVALNINPKMEVIEAVESMSSLIESGEKLKGLV